MKLYDFLNQILSIKLTLNEITVLLELGFEDFTREDLLSNAQRVPVGTYSASALTRTLQKLSVKNPAIVCTYLNNNGKTTYRLVNKCEGYSSFKPILLQLAHSKLMTLNTTRVALQLILESNRSCTVRYLGKCLNLDPDYIASTVLPRMFVIGLLKKEVISNKKLGEVMYIDTDILTDALEPNPNLLVFSLDLAWQGAIDEVWL